MSARRPWAVIAGGGTAGHVLPALAVARAMGRRGHGADEVLFVGSRRGLEARLVGEAGFHVVLLPGRGLQRRLTLANVGAVAGLAWAVVRAVVELAARRPAVVLSVGGYAAVPCALAAVALRVPLVLAEANARAGAANRLVARFARASAVAFPGTGLPREVVTGNPVRPEILALDHSPERRAAARAELGVPAGRRVVAVTGGSLGARRINTATLGLVRAWSGRSDVAVRHVVGSRDWAEVSAALPEIPAGGIAYQAVEYEERMDVVLAAADVAVCRAGGTTVAELAVAAVPAVLVPLPSAPGDHQTANARALADAGGAVVVPDRELTAERLAEELDALLSDDGRRRAMAAAARSVARPDAAEAVADLLEQHASRRPARRG